MLFIYEWPNWATGVFIVIAFVALVLGLFVLVRRFHPKNASEKTRELSLSLVGLVGTVHSLLLAFCAVQVWQQFDAAGTAVAKEASAIGDLYRDIHSYGGPETIAAKQAIRSYVKVVIEQEWPAMAKGEASEAAWLAFDNVFAEVATLTPKTTTQQLWLTESLRKVNEAADFRRERVLASEASMPDMFWAVVLIGTGIMFSYIFVVPATRTNLIAIGGVAASLGLVFFFIVALDHPFAGETSNDAGPFVQILKNADRLDSIAHARSAHMPK